MGFYLSLGLFLPLSLSFVLLLSISLSVVETLASFAALRFAIKMIFVSFIWLFLDLCSDHLLQTCHTAICGMERKGGGAWPELVFRPLHNLNLCTLLGKWRGISKLFCFCSVCGRGLP